MTKPILTTTEYCALCDLLQWAWTTLFQEPELCLKDVNYSAASKTVFEEWTEDGGLHCDYEPTGIDPIKTGECGLGLAEAFEYTLDEPNADNIYTMITNLMYKLNCNINLTGSFGNSWETLAPLVDHKEIERLSDLDDDPNTTWQTLEGYVIEDISLKNKISRIQEHYHNVDENGLIQIGDNLWIDGANSDILP